MKICLAVKKVNHYINKFIPELARGLEFAGNEIDIGVEIIWSESVFQYDVVYFHWPEFLFNNASNDDCEKLRKRIREMKDAGIIVAAHCHNLKPHDPSKTIELALYKIVYENCDVMIHMGGYSLKKMRADYPKTRHFLVPHHIYSHFYSFSYDTLFARRRLKLSKSKCVVLCFGAFRNEKERNLFVFLRKKLDHRIFEIVAPSYFRGKIIQKNILKGLNNLVKIVQYKLKGIKFTTKFLNDEKMQMYFCAADVVLIQRPDILNSGNLPMGFAAGKVVVGPNIGNISDLLVSTNNPVFKVGDNDSLIDAIEAARILVANGHGASNKKYAETYWSPEKIGATITTFFQGAFDEKNNKEIN